MSGARGAGSIAPDERRVRMTLVALLAAGVAVNMDRTMLVVALPSISTDLGVADVDTVLTVNLITFAVATPVSGWLVARFTPRDVFGACLITFAVVSACAFFAPDFRLLLACRAIQGASAGIMMPTTFAVIHATFAARRRPRAYALHAMVVMLSPAIGPLIGGVFADITWRPLFLVSVTGATVATFLTVRYMPRTSTDAAASQHLDWIGWVAAATGFPLLLAGFTKSSDWGLASTSSLTVLGLGAAAIAFFVAWELRRAAPLIELRMLEGTTFRRTIVLEWLVGIPYHVQLVAVPMSVSTVADRSPLQAGLLITPAAIGTIAVMRPASRVMLTRGARCPVVIGACLLLAATVGLTATGADGSNVLLATCMVALGMGAGLSMMPITAAGLDAVEPPLVPQASAMRLLNKMLAQAIGVSIALSLVAWRLDATDVVAAATSDPASAEQAFRWLGALLLVPAVAAVWHASRLPVADVHDDRPVATRDPDLRIADNEAW